MQWPFGSGEDCVQCHGIVTPKVVQISFADQSLAIGSMELLDRRGQTLWIQHTARRAAGKGQGRSGLPSE